ncbi:pyridoxamine 5'-phosphate oxidase family protein [Kitasatospora sp. NPDC058115]|uniref:pyridoxamine 5'-phosphate oxidase family protein n=1 Tax=Kitasatospora sp. NPDC058115 TaxID=3346347 RepID=UPI0036D81123
MSDDSVRRRLRARRRSRGSQPQARRSASVVRPRTPVEPPSREPAQREPAQREQVPAEPARRPSAPPRELVPLERAEALRLLGGAPFGRIVFTVRALPAIRPVNHLLVDDTIVIRTHDGAALSAVALGGEEPGVVVAYEADAIDPVTRLGWSVVVTGFARPVTDPVRLARYRALLSPWVDASMDHTVAIQPDLVAGYRLVAGGGAAAS